MAGTPAIFLAAGDGVIYSFAPATNSAAGAEVQTLKVQWRFDPDPDAPKENVHQYNTNRREGPSNIYSMPVIDDRRIYFTVGGDLWWGKNEAWTRCIEVTRQGRETSASQVWSYPLNRHSLSSPAVHRGLVFVADCGRVVHCLDAKTGQPFWSHETKGEIWASPLVADGKVYLGTRRGDFWVFKASKEKEILASIDLDSPISATVTAANRVLYVATMFNLYAIKAD